MTIKPPSFCSDAVATAQGWADRKTGKVVYRVKGLLEKIRNQVTESKPEIVKMVDPDELYDELMLDQNFADVAEVAKEWVDDNYNTDTPEFIEVIPTAETQEKINKKKKYKKDTTDGT